MTILAHRELETLAIEQGRVLAAGGGVQVLYSVTDRMLLMTAPTDDAVALDPGHHRWAAICERREMSHSEAMQWGADHGLKVDASMRAPRGGLF